MKIFGVPILFLWVVQGIYAQDSTAVWEFRNKLNQEFSDPETSPLPPGERLSFPGLEFFKYDPNFQVVADFVRTPSEPPFRMPTTTEIKKVYVKYGELYFLLDGQEVKLNVYQNQNPKPGYEDYLFLPFTDRTNGRESYAGGRYLDLMRPLPSQVILDFNRAYNPYCAYSGDYSCPIPPAENHLDLRVTAGVKAYKK